MIKHINLEDIKEIAKKAGDEIMKIYKKDFSVEYKEDSSPLTEADIKANEIICKGLSDLNSKFKIQNSKFKDIPILSEENSKAPYDVRKNWEYYWCIDPIDGTKEFIKKNGEFTVNIALIYKNTPVLGVVYAPAIDEMYYAKRGEGAYKNTQKLPLPIKKEKNELIVVASKSHLNDETKEFIAKLSTNDTKISLISKGSSLKLCMVAEGSADIYPRLAPTMEWDTAAADAILRESGKMTFIYEPEADYLESVNHRLKPLTYNKSNLLNPWFVVS